MKAFGGLPQSEISSSSANAHAVDLLAGLNNAAQSAGMNVWEWDIEHDALKFNRNLAQFYGVDADEAESNPRAFMTGITHPDDRERYLSEFNQALKGKRTLDIHYRVKRRDGTILPLRVVGEVYRATSGPNAGKATRVVGVTIDMSMHAERESHIVEQSKRQQDLLERINLANEAAQISMWEWDAASGVLSSDTNLAATFKDANLTGAFRVDDFVECVVHADDRDAFLTAVKAMRNGGNQLSVRFRYGARDGHYEHAQLHGRMMRNERGEAARFVGVSWNVTSQVNADAEIARQSREQSALSERLRMAAAVAGIDVWDWDLVTDKFTAETHMAAAYGRSHLEYASGRELLMRVVHKDDAPSFLAAIERAAEDGETLQHGFRAMLPDGTFRHAHMQARVFRDANGKAIRLIGATIDRTDEIRRHEELKQQAEEERALRDRLNLATETARIAIWDQDMISGKLTADDRFKDLFGIPRDTPTFRLQEGIHPDVRDRMLAPLRDAFADPSKNEVLSIRHRTTNPLRDLQYVQTHMRVFRTDDGKPARILGVTWDVTEEVRHADELKRQAEKERALVERLNVSTQAAGISPWEFDLKNGCFSWCGPRPKVFGMDDVPVAEYFNKICEQVVEEDKTVMQDAAREAITKGQDNYSYRFRFRAKDGTVYHMQNFGQVIRSERGNIRYCVGVTWDVTKEVEATEQLQKRAEENRQLIERLNIATNSANIGSWEMDLVAQRFLWVENPVKTLGIAPEDFGALAEFAEHIVPEDRQVLPSKIKQAVDDGSLRMDFRYRALGVDGAIVHIQTFGRVFVDERRRPIRSLGVSWDVTREVEAEERLRQQAQQERRLLERLNIATDAAGISSWEIDLLANKFLWIENPLTSVRRTQDGNELQRDIAYFAERMLPEDRSLLKKAIRDAKISNTDRIAYRYRVFGENGGIVHVQTFGRLILDDTGNPARLLGVSWDVTHEVEAAETLRRQASEKKQLLERLSIASDAAGISSWELDLTTRKYLWIENPLKSVLSSEADNNPTPDIENFYARAIPEDRGLMRQAITKSLAENIDRVSCRYRARGRDGGVVYVQTHARVMFGPDKQPVRILGVSWDVTHEVQAAEQLRHQAERLRDVERRLERASLSSSEGHWEADVATGHLWCSSSFHTLLGYLEGEIENRVSALDRLVHDNDRSTYLEALRNHLTSDAKYDVETRLRTSNGDYRWFRMRGMAERDDLGHPLVMAGSIHDIHQQKEIEDAYKLAQRRFERAINGTQDGLWELDLATEHTWCSPRLAVLLGYPPQAMEGTNLIREAIHPDDMEKASSSGHAHFRLNLPFDIELRLKNRGGDYRWYRARATAERGTDGRAVRLSGSLQDVTEAHAARQELLRATEAAEAANRAKSAFLANVSHEIRTPMNGIIGMTGLMIDTKLDRSQRDYAETIRSSADSLLSVINDILDFSKIEAGKLDLETIDMDLRTHVENIGSAMAFQAASKGLELIVNVHPEVPDRVHGDPQRLRQCLINLLGNAIKFTKQGEIVLDVCAVGRHEGRVLTHFEIRDTGTGIPAQVIPTLFQPFVQADSSTTRHFGGTGLGLSIVRRLIEMMGGQVGVVSEVGKGSTFFFTLSLEPSEQSTTLPVLATAHGRRILIVDDNATNRRVLGEQLAHAGYEIASAKDGMDALVLLNQAHAEARGFDAVILDYQMPDMDCAMLGERINSNPLLANTRLVTLTSLDRQGDAQRFRALGFAAYMTKPVRSRDLLDCMQRVLAGEARQWQMESQPMITRSVLNQLDAQQRFQGKILLVEDNVVNQKVASRYLERMGCTVRIAHNGLEGVAAFEEDRFDLIFMDVQMPVMDGLTATGKIRELESTRLRTGHRTPIVALTANAMRGDQERCEAAGMDSFLTKPIEIDRLREILGRFGLGEHVSASLPAQMHASTDTANREQRETPPLDLSRLNEITDGDAEFAHELIETFILVSAEQIVELAGALDKADRGEFARAAHKLKGACANIHAIAMRDLAYKFEAEAHSLTEPHARDLLQQLTREFARLKEFVADPSVLPAPIRAVS